MNDLLTRESLIVGGVISGIAFVLTFLAGLFGGVGLGSVFVNSVLYALLFMIIGVGVGILLEKMVPGIWESEGNSDESAYASSFDPSSAFATPHESGATVDYTIGADSEGMGEGLSMSIDEEPSVHADFSEDTDAALSGEGTPLRSAQRHVEGDYMIINDKRFPNDPEEYAKAVRTMLNRD